MQGKCSTTDLFTCLLRFTISSSTHLLMDMWVASWSIFISNAVMKVNVHISELVSLCSWDRFQRMEYLQHMDFFICNWAGSLCYGLSLVAVLPDYGTVTRHRTDSCHLARSPSDLGPQKSCTFFFLKKWVISDWGSHINDELLLWLSGFFFVLAFFSLIVMCVGVDLLTRYPPESLLSFFEV